MGTVVHPKSQMRRIRRELTKKDDTCFGLYVRASMVLDRFGPDLMSGIELQVVRFILGRTLSFSKHAETIAFSTFQGGLESDKGWVTKGTGLSESSIRKALRGLLERDLLTIHAFKEGDRESDYRLYEVNLDKLLVYKIFLNEEDSGDEPLVRINTPPYCGLTPINKEHIKIEPSSIEEGSATTAPTPPRSKEVGKRIEIDCNEDPREMVKRIASQATTTQATRVAQSATAIPKVKWKTQEIQALLDKARSEAALDGYKVPRVVVVAKNIGVLHRRMRDSELASPLDFFTWALKNWSTVASANRRNKARQMKDTQAAQSEMSLAPNFNDLAFRYPYILTFYNDRAQESINTERETKVAAEKVAKVAAASQEGIQARREIARQRDLERQKAHQALEEQDRQTAQRVRRQPRAVRPVADDDVFPEFKPRVWGE